MFRRLLTAAAVLLVLGSSFAPGIAFAIGEPSSHTDCCCPDPKLCPIVRGEHLCSWMKRGEKPAADTTPSGPRIARCADADTSVQADAVVWLPPPRVLVSPVADVTQRPAPLPDAALRIADPPELPPPRS